MQKNDDVFELTPKERDFEKQDALLVQFLHDADNELKNKLSEVDSELLDALGSSFSSLQSIFYNNNVLSKNVILLINDINNDNHSYILSGNNTGKLEMTIPSRYHTSDHVFNIINGIGFLLKSELISRNDAIILALAASIHDAFHSQFGSKLPDFVRTNLAASIVYYSNIVTFNDRNDSPYYRLSRILNVVCERFTINKNKMDVATVSKTIYDIVINSTYPYDDKPVDRLSAIFRDLDRLSAWFSLNPIVTIYGGLYSELYRPYYFCSEDAKYFIEFTDIQNKFMNEFVIYSPDAVGDYLRVHLAYAVRECQKVALNAKARFANETPNVLLV